MPLTPLRLGQILLKHHVINREQLEVVLREAKSRPRRTTGRSEHRSEAYELVLSLNFPNPKTAEPLVAAELAAAIAAEAGLETVTIDTLELDADLIEEKISRPFARRARLLPLEVVGGRLQVACADPFDVETIENYRRIADLEIDLVVAPEPAILSALKGYYGLRHSVKRAEVKLSESMDLGNLEQLVTMKSDREIESSDQHIVNAVEHMLQQAFDLRASDIHIEPKRERSIIRFRIDGVLHEIQSMPKLVHRAIISRLKTMSRLDIAEKRRPQDGRFKTSRGEREVELRVSTLPVAFGEKIVMRIFDPEYLMQDLSGLGFFADELSSFEDFIARPHGLILVTGPTGSGKTTSLYSALRVVCTPERNVTTIEDPIEMVYEPFNQTAVQPKIGVDFAKALRSILRQDPDIIMVGEIRDGETAQYAVQAALTGHLVFSTLHTNDASSAIGRLGDLGIERFLIASTLLGCMAQRLVRKTCDQCAEERPMSPDEAHALGIAAETAATIPVRVGSGCKVCRSTGYYGRTGIFEVLPVDDRIKQMIIDGCDTNAIKLEATKRGMLPLRQSAIHKIAVGLTTPSEVLRVTGI